MSRTADYVRKTKETDITLSLELDGSGVSEIDTGIGFFDHMLEGFARHGFFDLSVKAEGDLIVDCHHTIEDTGIVLGNAIKKAVGDKKGIKPGFAYAFCKTSLENISADRSDSGNAFLKSLPVHPDVSLCCYR